MVYLVDMENVSNTWMALLSNSSKADVFLLFYTNTGPSYTLPVVAKLVKAKCGMEFIHCCTGLNALDFQLVAELGMRAAKNPSTEYAIVSGDKGFDAAVSYLKARKYAVSRIDPVLDKQNDSSNKEDKMEKEDVLPFSKKLKGLVPESALPRCSEIMQANSSVAADKKKMAVYRALTGEFGQNDGLKYYRKIKGLL